MIGNILLVSGGAVGLLGMAIWYLLFRNYLKKNENKKASEVEPTVKKFMTVSSLIAILFLVLSVAGVLLRNQGI